MSLPVCRHKPMRASRKRFGAFDCETLGLDGEIVFVTACYESEDGSHTEPECFDNMRQFVDWVLADEDRRGVVWYAHNAEYDWRYLIQHIGHYMNDYDIDVKVRGGDKVYEVSFKRKGDKHYSFISRDSMAVFPFSLKEFAEKFSSKEKLDIGLDKGVVFDKNNPCHVEYAKRDACVLLECMANYDAMVYARFGVHIKGTVASTSYNAWLRHMPEGNVYYQLPRKIEDFVRKAYYGGIVHIRHVNVWFNKVVTYDINSSYPNVMCKYGIPTGAAIYTEEFDEELPGFYRCIVDTSNKPEESFYFIPVRDERKAVTWARGKFETFITSMEIKEARKRGYVIDVIDGYKFERIEYPFNDYVEICKSLRKEFKGQALETVAKLMQNSLYGKFGMGRIGDRYIVSFDYPEPDKKAEDGKLYWQPIASTTKDGVVDVDYVYKAEDERDAPYMFPHWAAWITAAARLELLNVQEIAGNEYFIYADTDSVTIFPQAVDRLEKAGVVGGEYGQVKNEGIKERYVVFGPKAYAWIDPKDKLYKFKMKGIPKKYAKDQEIARQIHKGQRPAVEFHVSKGLLQCLKHGIMHMVSKRSPTNPANLQSWVVNGTLALPKCITS